MTAPFSARRHADEFESLVSRRASHEPLTEGDAVRFARLLEVVEDLRALPEVAPRPEFVADLRSRLMAEADTVLLPVDRAAETRLTLVPGTGTGTRTNRRLGVVLGGAAMVGAAASMAVAAQSALPGDSLYPVKRALEGAEAQMATSEASRGSKLLDNAAGRLDEVDRLSSRDSAETAAAVPATLTDFQEQALDAAELLLDAFEQSGDKSVITGLRTFTVESMGELEDLQADVPDDARDELVQAGVTLARIDERAEKMCSSCEGGLDKLPAFLLGAGKSSAGVVPAVAPGGAPESLGETGVAKATKSKGGDSEATVSTQDTTGLEVPELDVTGQDTTTTDTTGETTTTTDATTQVKDPLKEVTKSLEGKDSVTTTLTDPVAGDGGLLDTVGQVLGGVTGTLSGTGSGTSLLP